MELGITFRIEFAPALRIAQQFLAATGTGGAIVYSVMPDTSTVNTMVP